MMNSATYIINAYRLRFWYYAFMSLELLSEEQFEWIWCMFLMFPAYSKCITNVDKSIVICCFGNTEKSNSLGGELTWSNDELNNIFNTYRLWFVYLCVYAIGAILWRPFEWVWCMFLMFPSHSKCITNVNKSIVICCFGTTEISNSLGRELTWSNDDLSNVYN